MKSKTIGTYLLLAVAAVGVVLAVGVRSFTSELAAPAEKGARSFRQRVVSRIRGAFRGAEAEAENVSLRRAVASLAILRSEVERLDAENGRLRRALGYVEKHPAEFLAAGVLSRGGAAGVRDVIKVDKGSLDGVREGAVVMVPEGLVGRVMSVSAQTADVMPITDPSLKVSCRVELPEGPELLGVLSGGRAEALVLRHLSNVEEVPPRSRVLTSGRGGVFPPGIEIGTLLDVRKDAQGLLREGEVQPSVDCSTLEDVFIRREN